MDVDPGSGAPLDERLRRAILAHPKRRWRDPMQREAAVALLNFERAGEPWIVFTKRSETLKHHRGEVSFPGGVRDPGDADLAATALRESHEELGIEPALVRILGELDDLPTFQTGYVVSPFVAWIPEDHVWSPNPGEIAEVLEFPLRELAAIGRSEVWERGGMRFPMYMFEIGGAFIWGLTARILQQFLEVAGPALGVEPPAAVMPWPADEAEESWRVRGGEPRG